MNSYTFKCSFCGKSPPKLLAGPTVCICQECVDDFKGAPEQSVKVPAWENLRTELDEICMGDLCNDSLAALTDLVWAKLKGASGG